MKNYSGPRGSTDNNAPIRVSVGVAGPRGRQGPKGDPGKDGLSSALAFEFPPTLEWVVQHNQNTRRFFETLTDEYGRRFFAPIQIIDDNSFVVKLTAATAGRVDVFFSAS